MLARLCYMGRERSTAESRMMNVREELKPVIWDNSKECHWIISENQAEKELCIACVDCQAEWRTSALTGLIMLQQALKDGDVQFLSWVTYA